MTRVAIHVSGSIRDGIWTPNRGEGRVALNLGAVLAVSGYKVFFIPNEPAPATPVAWSNGIEAVYGEAVRDLEVDFFVDSAHRNWPGGECPLPRTRSSVAWEASHDNGMTRGALGAHGCIATMTRLQLASFEPVAIATGYPVLLLPMAAAPIDWWREHYGLTPGPTDPQRDTLVWTAHIDEYLWELMFEDSGSPLVAAIKLTDHLQSRGWPVIFARGETVRNHPIRPRIAAVGKLMAPMRYDELLRLLQHTAMHLTHGPVPGSLLECLNAGVAPLVSKYNALWGINDVAIKHGVLWSGTDVDAVVVANKLLDRTVAEPYIDELRVRLDEHTPAGALAAWKKVEEACQ